MSGPIIKRVPGSESFQNFREISITLGKLLKGWFYRGATVTMELAIGDNTMQHNLGRVATKVIPVMQDAASSFYYTTTADPKNSLIVNSSAIVTVTFYVD